MRHQFPWRTVSYNTKSNKQKFTGENHNRVHDGESIGEQFPFQPELPSWPTSQINFA